MEGEIDIPSYFLCPISLEIMKDPVTTSTGITYDRISIERWLFSNKNNTCPVTKQSLTTCDLTPNHTLRRLIQFWCTLNASHGVERFPTPKPPATKPQIQKLIRDAKSHPRKTKSVVRTLRLIASENATNKLCFEDAGVLDFLSIIVCRAEEDQSSDFDCEDRFDSAEEALNLLYNLHISETGFRKLLESNKGMDFIRSLAKIMKRGSYESRVYAVLVLKSILQVTDSSQVLISNLDSQLFSELIQILQEQISAQATEAALRILIIICPKGRNRKKAVQAGGVRVLIELLLDEDASNKKAIEMEMTVLDLLCQIAEGRAELLGHALGMAVVSRKILRVSDWASERAVNIVFSIGKFCGNVGLIHEMLGIGVVTNMCLVIQSDCGSKTKEKAKEFLRLHARIIKGSPCLPTDVLASLV